MYSPLRKKEVFIRQEGARILERFSITADARNESGKGSARRLRRKGLIPAVLYGRNRVPLPIAIAKKELAGKVRGNVIIHLTIRGLDEPENAVVMIKDLQKSNIKGDYLHVDLQEISLKDRLVVSVPVELRGTPEGLSEGAFVSQILREVAIECLPTDIPSCIIGDVSGLGIGESLDAGKLQVPRDVELITPVTETVVTIAVPTVAAVKEETEEEIEGDQVSEPKIEA